MAGLKAMSVKLSCTWHNLKISKKAIFEQCASHIGARATRVEDINV